MSQADTLRAAGFSDGEISAYATKQRPVLAAAGFSDDEINGYLGPAPPLDTAAANKAFARAADNSIRWSSGSIANDIRGGVKSGLDSFVAPFEAAANAGTGLVVGFPAYIAGALAGFTTNTLLGNGIDPIHAANTIRQIADYRGAVAVGMGPAAGYPRPPVGSAPEVDENTPKNFAEAAQSAVTYAPRTKEGQEIAGKLMWPLEKLAEGAKWAGEGATNTLVKAGDPFGLAAPVGAVTDAAIQMLAPMLLGELGRKLGGQHVTAEDMGNVAKVIAAEHVTPPPADSAAASALSQAQSNNRFSGQASGAGRLVGMTQPPGTPLEKLFSNFADRPTTPEAAADFRAKMFDRANADPRGFQNEVVASGDIPLEGGLMARVDAAAGGRTRVQILEDGAPIAAASIERGMVDSIAVIGEAKGRNIGTKLLSFLDERHVANIDEVPDRSPGFVRIQRAAIEARHDRAMAIVDRTASVEHSLRAIYDQTGIGPFTVVAEAAKDPSIRADLVDPNVEVPKAFEQLSYPGASTEVPPLKGEDLIGKSYEELDAMLDAAIEHNKAVSIEGIGRFFGEKQARDASDWSMRKIDNWLEKNVTTEADDWMQARYINEDMIKEHRAAVNDFDTESPEALGRSIALRARNVDEPGFFTSPDGHAFSNALRYAKEQGWDMDKVMEGMRGRSAEWVGEDAPELFDRLFKRATELPVVEPPLAESPRAIGAPEPQNVPGSHGLNAGINPADVASAVRGIVKDVKDVTNGMIDSKAGQEVIEALFPMSKGSDIQAKAVAQRFANAMRLARYQWQRMSEFVRDNFTGEERKVMWDAADEENLIRSGKMAASQDRGLDRLTPKQLDTVQHLHELSLGLWKRAQDAGMVEGEGLPFWTPRMAVRIGEDGDFLRPGGEGKAATSTGEGGNVKTSTPNTKQRKYTLAEETEAAMKARLGDNTELVRDIGTMPLAMSRMAQAIAGRELVNQLKEYGQAIGELVVSDTGGPGFTTIDHPAFTTYKPDFITDADGKMVARTDQNGDIVMTRNQMHISDEWAGPLKAVLSKTDGAIYKAYMLMKSKAMTAIMISPAAHNMVIWGRAMAYDPAAVGTLKAYFSGHALAKDPGLMGQAISDGMVPLGANKGSMMDVTDVARGIGKEGGWGDPNESWINLATQKAVSVFSEGAADFVKAKMDAFGDFWHHTLLWKQVGALQTYIYNDYRNFLLEKGHPPEVAGPIAAHLANRYAGAVAAENSSEMLRKALNVMLFSRSFNVGNIGAVHDTVFGLPAGLRAKMIVDVGEEAGQAGVEAAVAKARKGIIADVGVSMLLSAAASAGIAKLLLNQSADDIKTGYVRRFAAMMGNIQDHPLNPGSYNPYRILPSWENEAGKQDRIDLGAQPGGRHEYLRLPTGKVVEDTVGWLIHAPETLEKKLSPTVKAAWQAVTNDKGFGVPVEDPSGNTLKHITQGLEHVIAAQVPMEQLKTLADVIGGHGTELDKTKLAGTVTGFTVSQGNPHGPEEAAFYAQQDRIKTEKAYAMEAVKDDIKKGNADAAYERLSAIGLPPREIVMTIQNIKNPRQGMSKQQTRRFETEANTEDRATMENARR